MLPRDSDAFVKMVEIKMMDLTNSVEPSRQSRRGGRPSTRPSATTDDIQIALDKEFTLRTSHTSNELPSEPPIAYEAGGERRGSAHSDDTTPTTRPRVVLSGAVPVKLHTVLRRC